MEWLTGLLAKIKPLDSVVCDEAWVRQNQLTKPAGSLGQLEAIAVQMAGITSNLYPKITRKAVIVMAADHGLTAEGVSAYPAAVTPQMVLNFLRGGAAINALAQQAGAEVIVVDIGVAAELEHPLLRSCKVAYGTANMAQQAAMTRQQVLEAIQVGVTLVDELVKRGVDLIATGEMGIGNTSAASALTSVLLDLPVEQVTGRGTGINDQQLVHKIEVLEHAIALNQPQANDPLDVLAKVGGLEIAGLIGVILVAAAHRIPVVLDGFIASSAALLACAFQSTVRDYLFAGHISVERGHRYILEHLGLRPLLDLGLRLGEGTGAALAIPIIEAALRVQREMATFGEAGVNEKI
jgi:nicotinate-nucleotide--dimethylbenzimidazole phosphoribosyltransferase